jgi:hypothetical protein
MAILAGCAAPGPSEKRADKATVKPEDFSYCGIDCKSCDVFKATVLGDHEARLRAAKRWAKTAQEHWHMKTLDPDVLDCAGCRTTEVQHKGHGHCPIRPCARKRGLVSCGLCPEWRQCDRLSGVLQDEPEARKNLKRIAAANRPTGRDQ